MAKFYGKLGLIQNLPREDDPDTYESIVTEIDVRGDVITNTRRFENNSGSVIDNVQLSNQFSILGDARLYSKHEYIRYLEWKGTKWTVTTVKISDYPPRLLLSVGGPWLGTE